MEFELIHRYLRRLDSGAGIILGVGDDCALIAPPPGRWLAVSLDTLVSGVHFAEHTPAYAVGWKALAVNLSDLAAMGAEPGFFTLGLTLPEADEGWLSGFAEGLFALAERERVPLVGGDLTRGPLAISIEVHGWVTPGKELRRRGAQPGDVLALTGPVGAAGLALRRLQAGVSAIPPGLRARLDCPEPRLRQGQALAGRAHAAIDVSDGVAQDLGHLLRASGVGARCELGRLPLAPEVAAHVAATGDWSLPLAAGDDYELVVALPALTAAELCAELGLTAFGEVTAAPGVAWIAPDGREYRPDRGGFDHFAP